MSEKPVTRSELDRDLQNYTKMADFSELRGEWRLAKAILLAIVIPLLGVVIAAAVAFIEIARG